MLDGSSVPRTRLDINRFGGHDPDAAANLVPVGRHIRPYQDHLHTCVKYWRCIPNTIDLLRLMAKNTIAGRYRTGTDRHVTWRASQGPKNGTVKDINEKI
jgi:hypothetical protein